MLLKTACPLKARKARNIKFRLGKSASAAQLIMVNVGHKRRYPTTTTAFVRAFRVFSGRMLFKGGWVSFGVVSISYRLDSIRYCYYAQIFADSFVVIQACLNSDNLAE